MSLPSLPPASFVHKMHHDPVYDNHYYTNSQMREYGALCRKMALEEAAKEVDHIMFFNGKTFGEKIRELK